MSNNTKMNADTCEQFKSYKAFGYTIEKANYGGAAVFVREGLSEYVECFSTEDEARLWCETHRKDQNK